MTKLRLLLYMTMVCSIPAFLATVFDFLALHDIYNDYVSVKVLESYTSFCAVDLPEWTAAPGEWDSLFVSWIFRFGFIILNIVTLVMCLRVLNNKQEPSTS